MYPAEKMWKSLRIILYIKNIFIINYITQEEEKYEYFFNFTETQIILYKNVVKLSWLFVLKIITERR